MFDILKFSTKTYSRKKTLEAFTENNNSSTNALDNTYINITNKRKELSFIKIIQNKSNICRTLQYQYEKLLLLVLINRAKRGPRFSSRVRHFVFVSASDCMAFSRVRPNAFTDCHDILHERAILLC